MHLFWGSQRPGLSPLPNPNTRTPTSDGSQKSPKPYPCQAHVLGTPVGWVVHQIWLSMEEFPLQLIPGQNWSVPEGSGSNHCRPQHA